MLFEQVLRKGGGGGDGEEREKGGRETWEMKRLRLEKDTRRASNTSTKDKYVHRCIKVLI